MKQIVRALLFLSLFLSACSPDSLSPETKAPPDIPVQPIGSSATKDVLPPPDSIATLSTSHIEQGPDGPPTQDSFGSPACGYQWAYQDLPELSTDFLQSIQQLQSEAQGNAYAFGENCVRADGSVDRFIPMETDFNIELQVADLSNESDLGEWIVKVMQVIEEIPADQITGPRPGRVTVIFQVNGEQKSVNFYINQYQSLPPELSPVEIYQALQTSQ